MSDKRRVKRLENNKWIDIEFKDIKLNDVVILIEPDGTLVESPSGKVTMRALTNAYHDDKMGEMSFAMAFIEGSEVIEKIDSIAGASGKAMW